MDKISQLRPCRVGSRLVSGQGVRPGRLSEFSEETCIQCLVWDLCVIGAESTKPTPPPTSMACLDMVGEER